MTQAPEKKRSLRICVAEDNADLRRLLERMLQILGHEVVCAVEHGQELVQMTSQVDVDLVIVDLDMPVVDGLEAAEEIVRRRKIPIILLSGHPDAAFIVLENEPITSRLQKPVSMEQLEAAISDAMHTVG